ncbi:hypothetical protein [Acetobacter orientalis]|uniref:hypothetical protein n=2 Tax=Acetobacter orientalis TaxID=146474 RepID=UPI0039EA1D16
MVPTRVFLMARTPDLPDLRPARTDDIADALMHALCHDGRRRVHDADELMARLVAERLVAHLERCGFVLCRAQDTGSHTASAHPHPAETCRE